MSRTLPVLGAVLGTVSGAVIRTVRLCALSLLVASAAQAAVEKKPIVVTQKVALTDLAETLTYPARIDPRIKASVLAETDGVVTQIKAPLGSQVRNGAPLIVIKNTDPVYQYSPMVMTSTVDGIVSHVEVTEGSRVARGDKLLLVTDPTQVRVAVEVTAQDLSSIHPGQVAELHAPGVEQPIPLKVKGISPFVDPATGTASCELEMVFKGHSKKQAPHPPLGLIGRVVFRVNARKGISIADSALTYRGPDPYVRVVTQGKAKLVPVMLGRKEAGYVEILKGLKPGDQLIERASGYVSDGDAVDVQNPPGGEGQAAAGSGRDGQG